MEYYTVHELFIILGQEIASEPQSATGITGLLI